MCFFLSPKRNDRKKKNKQTFLAPTQVWDNPANICLCLCVFSFAESSDVAGVRGRPEGGAKQHLTYLCREEGGAHQAFAGWTFRRPPLVAPCG